MTPLRTNRDYNVKPEGNCAILVINAAQDSADLYERLLQRDRAVTYEVLTEGYDSQILTLCQSRRFDAILLESYFPDPRGLKLLAQLQTQIGTDCPPIIVIDYNDADLATQALKAGAVDYLVRERITFDLLTQALYRAMSSREDFPRDYQQMEMALREKEQQLQQLSDLMPQFVWMCNAQGELDYVNRQWCEYSGLTREQSRDVQKVAACFHPAERQVTLDQWARALETKQAFEIEARLQRAADKTYRWFLIRCLPLLDNQGQLLRWIGTSTDIDDGKIAQLNEQFLRELELKLRQLSEVEEMQWEVVSRLGQYLQVDRSVWDQVDGVAGVALVKREWRRQEVSSIAGIYQISEYIPPDLIDRFSAGQSVVVADVASSPYTATFAANWLSLNVRAFIAVPCIYEGRWVATLSIVTRTVRSWRPDEVALLQAIVARLWSIMEQTRTVQALRESEERLRLAMEAAQMGTWDVDLKTGKALWSEQHFTLLGYEPVATGEASEEMWISCIHPEDRERVIQIWQQSRLDHQLYQAEYRVIQADNGQIAWIAALGSFSYDQSGQAIRSLGVVFNVTERKRAEDAVLQLNQQLQDKVTELQTLLEVIPIGIGIAEDRECHYIRANPAFAQLLNIPPTLNASLSAPDEERPSAFKVYQAGHEMTPEELPLQYAAQHGVEIHELEVEVVWQDGTVVSLLEYAAPLFDKSGQPRGSVGAFLDITARKRAEANLQQSEERYRYLAELIPQLVWTANSQGTLLDVNQRWSDYTGLTLAQVQRQGWETVIHPEDVPGLIEQWTIAQHNGTRYQAEGRMRRADGVYRWHLHQALPMKNEQGQILKWFGTATDIEVQKQLEQERDRILQREKAARAEAEQANRIKDEFLSILSHELRSPLNPILGWAKLLQARQFDPTKTAQALATIERNAKVQTQLIDDLLDVAKILRGKLSLELGSVDLSLVIEAAIETVQSAATAKSISLQADLSPLGLVSGDSVRLQQIIWNLLSNAIKFTPQGGRVEIELKQVEHQAQVTVSDTGKGIHPDFLPHIFESFRQQDTSITRQFGGLGLGLAIVKYLVEAHGGTITAYSLGEGQGATFRVRLPLLKIEPRSRSTEEMLNSEEVDLTGIRVLAVDDEPDARELLAAVLTAYGAQVSVAASATEALASFVSFRPDVLISDLGMPDVDGYSLIQQLRALPTQAGREVNAIALTAFAKEEDQKRALASGYQAHIAKPLEPEKLLRAVATLAARQ